MSATGFDFTRAPSTDSKALYARRDGLYGADMLFAAVTGLDFFTWLDAHPQNLFAPNKYTLDEYGLTVEQLEPIFAKYLATFDIEPEGRAR